MGGGTEQRGGFGADVSAAQFVRLAVALMMGTLVEWYDFTVYSQLANVITQLFFPTHDPGMAQLSFWGVYAVGFISRPAGACLFGHIGDSRGRRTTLLWSVLLITIPTLLIGCLPTYKQIGLAAPILMAVLRFIQGLAVGGEFGSAITYLYEMGPAGRKGMTSSLGQMAISPGIILGILVCQAVLYGCKPDQLLLYGWRVPFLVTAFTAPLAVVLRMHMPEPYEYLENKQQMVLQRVASTAANRVARTFSRQQSGALASPLARTRTHTLTARQVSLHLQHAVVIVPDFDTAAAAATPPAAQLTAHAGKNNVSMQCLKDGNAWDAAEQGRTQLGDCSGAVAGGSGDQGNRARLGPTLSLKLRDSEGACGGGDDVVLPEGCEEQFVEEVQQVSAVVKHHTPLAVLFRSHWQMVLLQFLLEANYGSTFYTFFSWAPPYLQKTHHTSMHNALWATLIAMVVFAMFTLLSGYLLCDSKVPKVWALLVNTIIIAAVTVPVLMCLEAGYAVGIWLLLPLMFALCGITGGLMTTIGPTIYPAAVRASGYNISHNLTMSLFGGLTPLIVSALAVKLHPTTNAAGLVIVLTALVTVCAGLVLVKVSPAVNAPCAAGAYQQYLSNKDAKQQEQQLVQMV